MDLFDIAAIEARHLDRLRASFKATTREDGGTCPCCDRWGKVYMRRINVTMARGLLWLSQQPGDGNGWIDVPNLAPRWLVRSNQLPTLRWWKLVEAPVPDVVEPEKRTSGLWRMTEHGRGFVAGIVKVPRAVFTWDGEPVGFSDEQTLFQACLGDRFSYAETMSTPAAEGPHDEQHHT